MKTARCLAFAFLMLAVTPAFGVDLSTLPPQARARAYLQELGAAGRAGDHAKIVDVCEKMLAMRDEVAIDPVIRFFYAQSLFALGRLEPSERELMAFLRDPDADPDLTDQALALMNKIEETRQLTLDCGNGVTLKLVKIPAGTFTMGLSASEAFSLLDMAPQRQVTISRAFYMGVHEVTQAQFRAVMGKNTAENKGDSLPIENMFWDDAVEFCRRLSAKTGRTIRLPTEAEWEYACRAGTTTRYNTGNNISNLQADIDGDETHTVGKYPPNAWGLYDMHGNVEEWCSDWYAAYDMTDTVDPKGPKSGILRITRGGSVNSSERSWPSGSRDSAPPDPFSPWSGIGFRVCLES